MDFLLVYPEDSTIGRYPFFTGTVAEASAAASAALAPGELLALDAPDGDAAALGRAGARRVSAAEASEVLRSLGEKARGALVPPGVVAHPEAPLRALIKAAGEKPLGLDNAAGQVLAVAGTADFLTGAIRSEFRESLADLQPFAEWRRAPDGYLRVEGATTWSVAVRVAQRRTARRFLDNGVLVEHPDSLWADPTCHAEPGARIGASVRLTGDTRIAAGAEVQSFCRLENTVVESGARILSHSVLLDSSIGRDAKVGPFAHIRPNTRLEPESFAGSFVETKNAVLARRAALPHLSYVGDADIGVRANLGAGTITCNYDGRGKHRTVVEAGAFVGSNAILVAPVTIGRRAFVAAGSVIVEDVPEGSLAIARGRQAVKPGRAAGRFEGADEV